jgi:glycosyltransferase involved in cell wall biosynthesis
MEDFLVSIVIPVYNAEDFIQSAVESAIHQPYVGEVILVEDGGADSSLAECVKISEKYDNVQLFQHPRGENKGAGESRNLGIRKAAFPYIAFLDADDYYLPNRFEQAYNILNFNQDIDGVYEAVGTEWVDSSVVDKRFNDLTTLAYEVSPDDLFSVLIRPGYPGHFQTNGITFRKSLLDKTGLFDTELRLHQDTHLWVRMAFHGTLVAGKIREPVAIRRIHGSNRITSSNFASQQLLRLKLFDYFKDKSVDAADYWYLVKMYVSYHPKREHIRTGLIGRASWLAIFIREVSAGRINLLRS